MSNCSPHFNGEPRQEGKCICDKDCFYWEACLKELSELDKNIDERDE